MTHCTKSQTAMLSLLALLPLAAGCAATGPVGGDVSPAAQARQLVLVVSDDWDATTATLQCYARADTGAKWQRVGQAAPANIGRTGLAWGRGLHGQPALSGVEGLPGPVKREGDGKAPAGAFALPSAFGYAAQEDAGGIRLPYIPLTSNVVGVDDVKSKRYNQIVRLDQVTKDWDSFETMRRDDGLYEWGVVVNHNTTPVQPGAGSCIFLHVWRGPGKPTAGCTAMSRDDLLAVMKWLDPRCRPVLVQLPRAAYDRLAKPWGLPGR